MSASVATTMCRSRSYSASLRMKLTISAASVRWAGRISSIVLRRDCRQSAHGAHAVALNDLRQPALVVRQPRAVELRMPQVQHRGRVAAVLAPHPGADQADHDVGIL